VYIEIRVSFVFWYSDDFVLGFLSFPMIRRGAMYCVPTRFDYEVAIVKSGYRPHHHEDKGLEYL
jgi:hypothetical protein